MTSIDDNMTKRKTVLVTGGGGMIGTHLIPYLMRTLNVVSLDLKPVPKATTSIVGSVTDANMVSKAVQDVDAILHMAYTYPSTSNVMDQIEVNLKGAATVLESCVRAHVKRIVFASTVMTAWGTPDAHTASAYHNFHPVNFYSLTKCTQELMAELYTRQGNIHDDQIHTPRHGLSTICLRIGHPQWVDKDPTRIPPSFRYVRDGEVLIAIEDLCEAARLALVGAPSVRFATLFLTGDYGSNHYHVNDLKETLGFQYRWQVTPEPGNTGAFLFTRTCHGSQH